MHRQSPWMSLQLVLAGLAAFMFIGCEQQTEAPPQPTPEVAIVTVQPQPLTLSTELPGRTVAYRVAEIRPQISGLIEQRMFTEGAEVEAGEQLYQIEDAEFKAAVDSARANLSAMQKGVEEAKAALNASIADLDRQRATVDLAETNRGRYNDLFEQKAVSASDRDQAVTDYDIAAAARKVAEAQVERNRQAVAVAEASIEQAQAVLQTASINLDYTKVTAPINGRIGRSNVTDGAIVTAYQAMPLATIQQLDPIYVDVPQSTSQLLQLRRRLEEGILAHNGDTQDEVKLILEDGSEYPLKGKLQFQDVTVNTTTGSVILRIVVPNPDGVLLPGMFVRAQIQEGVKPEAILIPQEAVSRNTKGEPLVQIVDESDAVAMRPVEIDRAIGNQWMIASGLSKGDRVIVEGMQRIRPGMKVHAVSLDANPDASPATANHQADATHESSL